MRNADEFLTLLKRTAVTAVLATSARRLSDESTNVDETLDALIADLTAMRHNNPDSAHAVATLVHGPEKVAQTKAAVDALAGLLK